MNPYTVLNFRQMSVSKSTACRDQEFGEKICPTVCAVATWVNQNTNANITAGIRKFLQSVCEESVKFESDDKWSAEKNVAYDQFKGAVEQLEDQHIGLLLVTYLCASMMKYDKPIVALKAISASPRDVFCEYRNHVLQNIAASGSNVRSAALRFNQNIV